MRQVCDVRPGDVLVYPARKIEGMGHALLIADVATNAKGQKAIICIEGNTPAREAHVVRNFNPLRKAWFVLDESDKMYPGHPGEVDAQEEGRGCHHSGDNCP